MSKSVLLFVLMVLSASSTYSQAPDTTDNATTKDDLVKLYQRYFDAKDEAKLNTLVYWPGVLQRERESFLRSLRHDLAYSLLKVELLPLERGETLEYELYGITFRPSLVPVCRMVSRYQRSGAVKNLSTSYLVGVKNGRYFITLASPRRASP